MPMQRSTAFGWANQFDASGTGRAVLTFDTPLTHRLAVGVQVLFWVFVLWLRRRLRISEKRIEANAEEVTA